MKTMHPVEVIARILCAEAGGDPDQSISGQILFRGAVTNVPSRPYWFSKIDAAKQLLLLLGETSGFPKHNATVRVAFPPEDETPEATVGRVWRTIIRDCGRWTPPAL